MKVRRIGRSSQVVVERPEDLASVRELDEALWAAMSAPRESFRAPSEFLQAVDKDNNGRITSGEIKEAIGYLFDHLTDTSQVCGGTTHVPLVAIKEESTRGRKLKEAARRVLAHCGKESSEALSLADIDTFLSTLKEQPLNGDGVVVPEAASHPSVVSFLEGVRAVTGGTADASGRVGVSEDQILTFLEACRSYLPWRREGEERTEELFPLGEGTPEAFALYTQLAPKVEEYFRLCRQQAFLGEKTVGTAWLKAAGGETGSLDLAQLPLAVPGGKAALSLSGRGLNPAFSDLLSAFREKVLAPALGAPPPELTEETWQRISELLAPYRRYEAAKPALPVEKLGEEKVKRYAEGDWAERARELLERDREIARVREAACELKKLLLYHAYLARLVRNFVCFAELYDPHRRALFEQGSAVLDGRWFELALPVSDRSAHLKRARSSNLSVLYLEVTGSDPQEHFTVCVPATAGRKGNLCVGKRGVFFDTEGKQYDAVVVDVIENPISLLEALASPFVGAWRFLVGKIETWSERSEKALQEKLHKALSGVASSVSAPAASPAGTLAWLSVSVAALSSAFAFVVKQLSGLTIGAFLRGCALTIGILCVAVLVPVGLVAHLKLRSQDLSSLLEGSGWAVNVRMHLTRKLRRHFTRRGRFFLSTR